MEHTAIYIRIFILLFLMTSCKSKDDFYKISEFKCDSLFIQKSIKWTSPPSDWKSVYSDTNFLTGAADVNLVGFAKDIILVIETSVVKTADDTIHLFNPADYGGRAIIGHLLFDNNIKSKAVGLNGKQLSWISPISLKLGVDQYEKLTKVDLDLLDEIISNYSYKIKADSFKIILSGP